MESDLKNLYAQAYQAYQEGRPTFVARLKTSAWGSGATGVGQQGAWMNSIDAVEQAGWSLDHWSTAFEPGGSANAFPLFRRREPWTPQDRPPSS